jgi:type IV pilus assembly protein PilC
MKQKTLSTSYLSAFCLEIALFLRAGISISDGIYMLKSDHDDKASQKLIGNLFDEMESGSTFSAALTKAGVFPTYMLEMVALAENTGKLEDTMRSLSDYYARQTRLATSIKNAVFYPVILIAIMMIVIAVILTQVLPIFNNAFSQMGAQMSPFAVTLMNFGQALSTASTVIFIVLGIIIVLLILSYAIPSVRATFSTFFKNTFGDKGIFKRISAARFAFAMAVAIESGIDTDDAITMATKVAGGDARLVLRAEKCRELLAQGVKLGDALTASEIFTSKHNKLLSLAQKTGSLSDVMHVIAERSEEAISDEIDSKIAKVEPTLVILTSVIVGVILLSVMLPLVSIMSTIG